MVVFMCILFFFNISIFTYQQYWLRMIVCICFLGSFIGIGNNYSATTIL